MLVLPGPGRTLPMRYGFWVAFSPAPLSSRRFFTPICMLSGRLGWIFPPTHVLPTGTPSPSRTASTRVLGRVKGALASLGGCAALDPACAPWSSRGVAMGTGASGGAPKTGRGLLLPSLVPLAAGSATATNRQGTAGSRLAVKAVRDRPTGSSRLLREQGTARPPQAPLQLLLVKEC
jgi:hypothetical protein